MTIIVVFIWSAIKPAEYFTWSMEAPPVVIEIIVLCFLYRRFRFTSLAYFLLWLQAITMLVGAHYTYSEVPLFNWLKESMNLERNYYDRLGHFLQGAGLAIVSREIFIRKSPVKKDRWLMFFVVCFCVAFGAIYELYECAIVIVKGTDATNFIGMQGDEWDAQWDMCSALIGTFFSLLFLRKIHDIQLREFTINIDK